MSEQHQERRNDGDAIARLEKAFYVYSIKHDAVIERLEKTVSLHSNEIWGFDDANVGIKAKLKTVVDARADEKSERLWWRTLMGVPIAGLVADWFYKLLHK